MWSSIVRIFLMVAVCPCVSSENATSGKAISTSVNQSLFFGAVSKEIPNTLLTKLTSSVPVSNGDGYLGSSSVNTSPAVLEEYTVQNRLSYSTSNPDVWSSGASTHVLNLTDPDLDQSVHTAQSLSSVGTVTVPVYDVGSTLITLITESFGETSVTKTSELQVLLQTNIASSITSTDIYEYIVHSKLLDTIWISDIPQ
ncbi:hypothetical protein LSH36_70g06039 [Paralvinella palmiformis]|uniref:Uncharacterized protein n=1 Tax=Paralvinella palmiformis TaxID=53620 RepID=A0AAD9NCZ8_9ANNE|nr:hypothetical protein LSH36_70g06039 [Paralvinella palmiformis]